MTYDYILFSLFSSFSIISGVMVISLSNAVHSVLFLIFLFCNIASLLLLLGVEFLSLLFLIVYVGAIAVLFLFVVMMLNIKILNPNFSMYSSLFPTGFLVSTILISQFLITIDSNFSSLSSSYSVDWTSWVVEANSCSNIKVLGLVLYTSYSFLFILCSVILLISMIGVIVLTIHQRRKVKKQDINLQITRQFKNTVKFSLFK